MSWRGRLATDLAAATNVHLNGERTAPPAAGAWTAIVLAGSRPGRDPLAERFGVPVKALVTVAGEPMIGRVVRSLLSCDRVTRVLILARHPDQLADNGTAWLARDPRIAFAECGTGIGESLVSVLGTGWAPWPALITTADHPLLTGEMIEHFLDASTGADASVGIVERSVVLARFPDARRTWIRFGSDAYTGANLFTLQVEAALEGVSLFARAEADRKRRLRLLWHLGPALALGAATRTLSPAKGAERLGRRLGIRIAAVPLPFPEAGIDVDGPEDHALATRILAAPTMLDDVGRSAVSVFDLDRTLTRHGTFTAFLLYAAARLAPWRLLLAPAAAAGFVRYRAGRISRKQLKERLQRLFLGGSPPRDRIEALAADYAARLRRRGFNHRGLAQIAEEKRQGRKIVLATAANDFYAGAIARELAVDELVCTRSACDNGSLLARIEGANCYGEDKLAMLRARLEGPAGDRSDLHVRFFSDHRSDACVMRWADEAFVVNPGRRFRDYAAGMGWTVLTWP